MTQSNLTDLEIHGDMRQPTLVRAFCRTCNAERSLKLKDFSGGGFLLCTACYTQEPYDPEGLLSE